MVELGHDDLIAWLHRPAHRVGEQEVDRGRVGSEHDLLECTAQEVRRCRVRVVEQPVSGLRGDERAAGVRVDVGQVTGHGADDGVRHLRATRAVQIHNRRARHLPGKRREARPDRREVQARVVDGGHGQRIAHLVEGRRLHPQV